MKDLLLKMLNDFVKVFDDEYNVKEGDEFSADLIHHTIEVTFNYTIADFYFYGNLYRGIVGEKLPLFHPFTWSVLHELGHLETMDEMENDTIKRIKLQAGKQVTAQRAYEQYKSLHNEKIANDWAINLVLKIPDEMIQIDEQWSNLLLAMETGE